MSENNTIQPLSITNPYANPSIDPAVVSSPSGMQTYPDFIIKGSITNLPDKMEVFVKLQERREFLIKNLEDIKDELEEIREIEFLFKENAAVFEKILLALRKIRIF